MCGIFAVFGYTHATDEIDLRSLVHQLSRKIRHRGPDWCGIEVINKGTAIAHERLAIIGTSSGA